MGEMLNSGKNGVKIHSAFVKDLDVKMYNSLLSLNYRERGMMRSELMRVRKYECDKSKVFYILDDNNKVIGWSLAFPHRSWFNKRQEIHFYVRKTQRKMGYGSMLAESVSKAYNGLRLCGSLSESSLFQRYGMESA